MIKKRKRIMNKIEKEKESMGKKWKSGFWKECIMRDLMIEEGVLSWCEEKKKIKKYGKRG